MDDEKLTKIGAPKSWPPPPTTRTSAEREREGKIVYTCEALEEEVKKKLWPMNIESVNDGIRFGITATINDQVCLTIYRRKLNGQLIWRLLINDNIDLEIVTGITDGIEHRTIEEALHYIKSVLLVVRRWEDWVDANTYWETERTEEGIKLVQDTKRYEQKDWD